VPEVAYVALGTNVGDREQHLEDARAALAALPDSRILAVSAVEETAPLGPIAQGNYFNQMVALETSLAPAQLLDELLRIEQQHGRERGARWGPRTLDLDIVMFGDQHVATDRLTVPHPQLARRDFWQRELIELRGEWR
jgi:2-amino-4-hydroxy-6-hydroxymethyldihydropteridine diphosphokinase